jgi:hypothetical protein
VELGGVEDAARMTVDADEVLGEEESVNAGHEHEEGKAGEDLGTGGLEEDRSEGAEDEEDANRCGNGEDVVEVADDVVGVVVEDIDGGVG